MLISLLDQRCQPLGLRGQWHWLPPDLRMFLAKQPLDSPVPAAGSPARWSAQGGPGGAGPTLCLKAAAAPTWPWGDKGGPGLAPVTGKAPPHQSPRVSGGRGRASGEYTGGDWCQQGRGLSLSRGGTGRDSATSASSRRPQPPVALGTEPSLPVCAQRLCLRVRLY